MAGGKETVVKAAGAPRIHGADALRGLAAVGVALHHMVVFVGLDTANWLAPVRSHFGTGVPLFFCISAFTMYHIYFDAVERPGFEKAFLIKRFARLMPLYLFAFVTIYFLGYLMYGVTIKAGFLDILLLCSLLFSFVPKLNGGGAAASWSIGVEMMFYLSFSLMVRVFRTKRSLLAGLFVAYLVSYVFQASIDLAHMAVPIYYAINPVLYMPCFFLGALVWMFASKATHDRAAPFELASLAILALLVFGYFVTGHRVMVLLPGTPTAYWFKISALSLAFSLVLYIAVVYRSALLNNPATRQLGKLSYSIYLLHMLVILYVVQPWAPTIKAFFATSPTMAFAACSALLFGILLPLSELAFRLIEQPAIRWGARVAAAVTAREKAAAI